MSTFKRSRIEQNLNYNWSLPTNDQTTITRNDSGLPIIVKENPSNSDLTLSPEVKYGVPSFINPYAVLTFPNQFSTSFNSLIDDPDQRIKFSSPMNGVQGNGAMANIDPTVYNLVNTPPDGSHDVLSAKTPYRYTDFLYCKYYGIIPNNHLITLRRYPAPTFDNLAIPMTVDDSSNSGDVQHAFKPIAQAVTWLGEETENKLSELLGFEVILNWKLWESQLESVSGNEQSTDDGPSMLAPASKFLTVASGLLGGQVNSPASQANSQYNPYQNGPYSHRIFGPVNVIEKTYKRDRGLDFKQSFTLNFHYSLKSIAGINPKAAMLDIMSNMLTLTYNNAAFWGGANRYFAQKPVYPFLGGRTGMNAWYRGDPVGFTQAFTGKTKDFLSQIGAFFDNMMADPIAALKKLATDGISTGMKIIGRGRAPDIVAMKSLLTGEPIGEWHMVVGNPYSPILNVGNLICTGAKFHFNDTLGADNFPTELRVTITMEHGRPRDKGDIESMFNEGEGRLYSAPAGHTDVFNSSSLNNSTNDSSYNYKRDMQTIFGNQIATSKPGNISTSPIGFGNKTTSTQNQFVKKNNTIYTPPAAAQSGNVGNSQFDTMVNTLSSSFSSGHDLAIKMGLASVGNTKLPSQK